MPLPTARLEGFDVMTVGIAPERETLRVPGRSAARRRCSRAGSWTRSGALLARGYGPALRPLRAIGYRQAVAVVRGEMDRRVRAA